MSSKEKFISQCVAMSPCIKVCKMDEEGKCKGCKRTLEEIKAWEGTSFEDREKICEELLDR